MGGLIFLLATGLWFAFCVFLARKIPGWIGAKRFGLVLGVVIFPVLLVAPVVDEIIGMRQFEQLCKERAVVRVSPEAAQVTSAKISTSPVVNLAGYWIEIQSQTVVYLNAETGRPFYSYESLITKGGRVARIALMGGTHSCTAKNIVETSNQLNLEKLLEQGKKS